MNADRRPRSSWAGFPVLLVLVAFLLPRSVARAAPPAGLGDRHPKITCVYPEDVFLHAGKGGLVIDVTHPPFGAKGDGVTDDTAAIVKAYDHCLDILDRTRWSLPKGQDNHISPYLYFPNGVYLISDTIVYSGPVRAGWNLVPKETQKIVGRTTEGIWDGRTGDLDFRLYNMAREYHPMKTMNPTDHVCRIRLIGQSRDRTIVRLKANSPGFGMVQADGRKVPAMKPVIAYGKSHMNNHVSTNQLRNMTIEVGPGNPGAIGVEWVGANSCRISNVTVRSLDGRGAIGIRFRIVPTQNHHSDITIDGCDYRINLCGHHVTHPALEHVTLRNQNIAGVHVQNSSTSLRRVWSENKGPAVLLDAMAAHAVVIDSQFTGGRKPAAAIDVRSGHLFVRHVVTKGYAAAVRTRDGVLSKGPTIDEIVTGQVIAADRNSSRRSLALPVEDVPILPWEQDLSQWANVLTYGAKADGESDDSAAVQAALNSGKSTIYFPKGAFVCKRPLTVPATVRHILGMHHDVDMTVVVKEYSDGPLLVEQCRRIAVRSECDRTLVCRDAAVGAVEGAAPKVFLSGGTSLKTTRNLSIWARGVNVEGARLPITAQAGTKLWVFGFKTERGAVGAAHLVTQVGGEFKGSPSFYVEKGGRLEVLGGVSGIHNTGFVTNNGGAISLVCSTSARPALLRDSMMESIVDFVGSKRVVIGRDGLPERSPASSENGRNILVPLYVNHQEKRP